jgi:hypothetical protein
MNKLPSSIKMGGLLIMKKSFFAAFCIMALCSLALVMKTETVRAQQEGYEVNDYVAMTTPTLDGNWTTADEWIDAEEKQLDGDLNVTFRLKYTTDYPSWVNQYYLIEFFDDTTDDAEDYWQICYAASTEFYGNPVGGTTPQTDCKRFDFVGHNGAAGFTLYKGDGTAWVESTDYTWATNVEIVESFGTSPLSDTPHWIAEIKIEHIFFSIEPFFWMRMAAYDASNAAAGVQAWPDSSVDVPDDWGLMNALQEPIPETLTIGVMMLLSSVSVLVGYRYFRKRQETEVAAQ